MSVCSKIRDARMSPKVLGRTCAKMWLGNYACPLRSCQRNETFLQWGKKTEELMRKNVRYLGGVYVPNMIMEPRARNLHVPLLQLDLWRMFSCWITNGKQAESPNEFTFNFHLVKWLKVCLKTIQLSLIFHHDVWRQVWRRKVPNLITQVGPRS